MSQRKLLLADDSITIQKVVNLTFADEGIEVITVGDGDSAMEKMAEIAPDLVMADVNMPGLNGYELCEKIRESDELKKTPVILLVGSFEPFDEEKARNVGADDFLTKPFQSIRQLVNKVTELLSSNTNGGTSSEDIATANTLRNFSVPEEYVSDVQTDSPQYGDAGMDDEMIQTDNAETYAFDETSKFESSVVDEPEFNAKTQPLNAEDIKEFSFNSTTEEGGEQEDSSIETARVNSGEGSFNQQESEAQTETINHETSASQSNAALFNFSGDDDLLEIPFEEDEEEELDAAEQNAETSVQPNSEMQASTEENLSEPVSGESDQTAVAAYGQAESEQVSTESADSIGQLSPEMIEAIAQRVVEKLSDKAVKDVAWEVVPQMADLIIKKMAEEKLKE